MVKLHKKSVQNVLWLVMQMSWTVLALAAAVLVFAVVLALAPVGVRQWAAKPVGASLLMAGIYVLAVAVLLAPFLARKVSFAHLKQRLAFDKKPTWNMLGAALAAWGVYMVVSVTVAYVLRQLAVPGLDLDQKQVLGFAPPSGLFEATLAVVSLAVVAPLFEELIFRGYLYGQLRRRTRFVTSAILTSLVFGVVHLQVNVGIDVFVLSLALCYVRERYDSIWPGVFVHALKNGLASLVLFILPLFGIHLI